MKYNLEQIQETIFDADEMSITALGRKQCLYLSAIAKLLYNLAQGGINGKTPRLSRKTKTKQKGNQRRGYKGNARAIS